MKNNVLAEIKYNGKTYVYYVEPDNPSSIKYGFLDNDIIFEVKDPIDIEIMNEASKQIFISSDTKNHIKLGTTIYHGKKFQEMYDENSKLKFFYEIKDGKYYMPADEDAQKLFKMFNSHEMFLEKSEDELNESNNKKEKDSFSIKKVLLIAGIWITVGISLSSCFARHQEEEVQINSNISINLLEKKQQSLKLTIKHNEEGLIRAIDLNENLSPDEKQLYKDQIKFVMKYKDYTDFDYLIDKLINARIHYVPEHNPYAAAGYNGPYDIYDYDAIDFEHTDKSDLGHEIGHQFGADHPGMGWGTYESTTSIVNSEHEYPNDSTGYNDVIGYQRVLYEIIGADPFAEYQQDADISHIVKELMKVINDENLANQLISSLDNVITYNYVAIDPFDEYTEEESNEAKINFGENKKLILETLSKYFYAAKGYPMEEDLISMLYLTSTDIKSEVFLVEYGPYVYNLGQDDFTFKKGQFLDDYIEKYKEHTLIFKGTEGEEIRIFINDSNRRVKKDNGIYKICGNSLTSEVKETKSESYSFYGHGLYEAALAIEKRENPWGDQENIPRDRIELSTYFKILYEIVGKEAMIEFYNTKDINVIINALTEIMPEEEKAKGLIYDIDVISNYYSKEDQEGAANRGYNLSKNRDNIKRDFNEYFEKVYGYSIIDDALINFYYLELQGKIEDYGDFLYNIKVKDGRGNEILIEPSDGTEATVFKGLIDEYYISDYPGTTVVISSPELENSIGIDINETNRKLTFQSYGGERDIMYCFDEGISKEK